MGGLRRLVYQPALDGVRALAVIAVLLFHAGTPGFDGGYLGVSVFFTLSGYLITSLLLDEHDATGSVDYRRFYGRRLRRLLPASAATVAVVVVIAAVTDVFDGVTDLRAQVVGALLQVSNWVLLAGDSSYQDLLAQASGTLSPLEHFWSLAIEEQFYWLWPPVLGLVLARFAAHRARLVVIAVVTVTSMIAAPVIAQVWGPDAAYWATPARLAEILVGALLAVVLRAATLPRWTPLLAPAALVVLAGAVVMFPSSSGPAYEGWLPIVALVSGGLILGLQAEGPTRRALSLAPIVALGRISYGVYLVHWPVYVIADADRVGVEGAPLTLLRLAITLAIAVASYRLIEQPIRTRQGIPFRVTISVAVTSTVALIAVALLVMPTGPSNYWNADADAIAAVAIDTDPDAGALTVSPTTPATTPATTPTVSPTTEGSSAPGTGATARATTTTTTTLAPLPELARPVRIVVTGDSTADALGTGIVGWAAEHPDLAQVAVQAAQGCGFVMGGDHLFGDEIVSTASCDGWPEAQLFPVVERSRPDVVAVMVSAWDLADRRWDDGELLRPEHPEYRARLLDTYTQLVDDLIAAGASRVAFIREPVPNVWWGGTVTDENDPGRHAVLAEVQAEVAAARPEHVRVIEFASWFTGAGLELDRDARPDGVHLAPGPAVSITDAYLGDQLMRAALL
jgi:peptidoglycan/LPS O-acetylase OafA/YrhL